MEDPIWLRKRTARLSLVLSLLFRSPLRYSANVTPAIEKGVSLGELKAAEDEFGDRLTNRRIDVLCSSVRIYFASNFVRCEIFKILYSPYNSLCLPFVSLRCVSICRSISPSYPPLSPSLLPVLPSSLSLFLRSLFFPSFLSFFLSTSLLPPPSHRLIRSAQKVRAPSPPATPPHLRRQRGSPGTPAAGRDGEGGEAGPSVCPCLHCRHWGQSPDRLVTKSPIDSPSLCPSSPVSFLCLFAISRKRGGAGENLIYEEIIIPYE